MNERLLKQILTDIQQLQDRPWCMSDDSDTSFTRITGGLTNVLYKATTIKDGQEAYLLVRIFGLCDGLLNRVVENDVFGELSNLNVSPKLYGVYSWGRLEEFIHDHFSLTSGADMVHVSEELDMIDLVGVALKRLHGVKLNIAKDLCSANVFQVIQKWLTLVMKYSDQITDRIDVLELADNSTRVAHCRVPLLSAFALSEAVTNVISLWDDTIYNDPRIQKSDVCKHLLQNVLCHNDLLAGNILLNREQKTVRLIDFEYAGYNYAVADIANVLTAVSESMMLAGFPQDVCSNYPSAAVQLRLVESTLGIDNIPSDEQEAVVLLLLFFSMADELRWTLWGIIQFVQAVSTLNTFDYVFYYNSRYNAYWDYRGMLWKLLQW